MAGTKSARRPILGVARCRRGGPTAPTGRRLQRRVFGSERVLQLRLPVKSKQEADERAAAELDKRANDHVKGEGETFGFPELLPDTNLRLTVSGQVLDDLLRHQDGHRYDRSGYRTRFSDRGAGMSVIARSEAGRGRWPGRGRRHRDRDAQ